LCPGNWLYCLLFEEAPRHTEGTQRRAQQHNRGAAIWDLSWGRRSGWRSALAFWLNPNNAAQVLQGGQPGCWELLSFGQQYKKVAVPNGTTTLCVEKALLGLALQVTPCQPERTQSGSE